MNGSGAWQRGEIYAGGRHLATYTNSTTYFNHADWLGTERVRTTVAGAVCESIASLPFGDGQTTTGSCGDPSTRHFTGKERDSESNLDNFRDRYNSSSLARFMSPDRGMFDWRDPQSLNRYLYTRNNPLKYIDPSGKYFIIASDVLPQVMQYIATLLASDSGRQLVTQIGFSSRANSFGSGSLPRTQVSPNKVNATNAQTTVVPGNSPGTVSGTTTTLDFSNIHFSAGLSQQTDFYTGLLAFTHDAFHISDANSASTLQGAAAAMAAGDAPSSPGAGNTTGGTAQLRALDVLSNLGNAAQNYIPNAEFEVEANQLIAYGQLMQIASKIVDEFEPTMQDLSTEVLLPDVGGN